MIMNIYKRKKLLDSIINSSRVKICNLKKKLARMETELLDHIRERNELDSQLSSATILLKD